MKNAFSIFVFVVAFTSSVQAQFSITTDASLLRSFARGQQFTTIGQSVTANFHVGRKATIYAGISYYVNGRYKNGLTATPKDPAGGGAAIPFTVSSRLGYRQFSVGGKHFFTGAFDNETGLNVYGGASFGLLSGSVENTYNRDIDTAAYVLPQQSVRGTGRFNRLTFDLTLGGEWPVAAGFFVYGEFKTWLRASAYPSPLLYNNRTPGVLMAAGGVRILFN